MRLEQLEHKKIGILGFGLEGRAVAEFLQRRGLEYDVLDANADADLGGFAPRAAVLGSDYLKAASRYEILFRSPGVKFFPELLAAQKSGAVISSQIKLFFENCKARIIGVTGTKGKGTTSMLIYEMLKRAGKSVYLGGNIGAEVLGLLDKLSASDWIVLELSSFQLQDLEQSPHIAVVLMVTSEHLDYHGDTAEYVAAKAAITKFQIAADFAVINADFPGSKQIGEAGSAKKYFVQTSENEPQFADGIIASRVKREIDLLKAGRPQKFLDLSEIFLPGYHNVQNICAAIQAAELSGADQDSIKAVVREFKGLEHRLEFVAERGGIKFYNDSFGTTPETCLAAVEAFDANEIVIVGGYDKKADYEDLGQKLAGKPALKAAVLIGQIAPQIKSGLVAAGFKGKILDGAKDLAASFAQIRSIAAPGDIVLLAPGTSSYDWFKNYKERGKAFKKLAEEF